MSKNRVEEVAAVSKKLVKEIVEGNFEAVSTILTSSIKSNELDPMYLIRKALLNNNMDGGTPLHCLALSKNSAAPAMFELALKDLGDRVAEALLIHIFCSEERLYIP